MMRSILLLSAVLLAAEPTGGRPIAPLPLDPPRTYRVTWLGMHCADMRLESAPIEGKPSLIRMVMTVETTDLFDSIYKVRSRIESDYHTGLQSTRRYHELSTEREKVKDDLWLVNPRAGKARRTKNGRDEVFEIPSEGVVDPLAMIYRFRALLSEAGQEAVVRVMTTEGAMEARAVAERWERFDTVSGPVTALKVVQSPVEDAEFARGGGLTMWLSAEADRVPYRIDLELPFGKLVAELIEAEGETGGEG